MNNVGFICKLHVSLCTWGWALAQAAVVLVMSPMGSW